MRTYTVICAFNNIYKFYDSTAFPFKMLQKLLARVVDGGISNLQLH